MPEHTNGGHASVVAVGHAALAPVHFCAKVSTPPVHDGPLHWVVDDKKVSPGQVVADPSHASATSQGPAFPRQGVPADAGPCTQPDAGTQESVVHALLSSQPRAAPPTHVPALHLSFVVHALPSWHDVPLRFEHTPEALHAWQSFGSPLPHAALQHTPSTHVAFAHMPAREQLPPCGSCERQVPPLQKKPPGQSVSTPQVPWHAVPLALQG